MSVRSIYNDWITNSFYWVVYLWATTGYKQRFEFIIQDFQKILIVVDKAATLVYMH